MNAGLAVFFMVVAFSWGYSIGKSDGESGRR